VHSVELDNKTIQDNSRFFDNDITKVPKMGIKNILDSNTIILMANGTNKADVVKYVMSGIIDENIPVSLLNINKGKVPYSSHSFQGFFLTYYRKISHSNLRIILKIDEKLELSPDKVLNL